MEQVRGSEVSVPGGLAEEDGTEDEDDGWKFVGDRCHRPAADPAVDLCPLGSKSKVWALADDDDPDEEVVSQSPLTPELVRLAAVHGFSKEKMYDAELALQDSSICRRVEGPVSPVSTDTNAIFVRRIMKALTDVP
jgi:hypothetical protein